MTKKIVFLVPAVFIIGALWSPIYLNTLAAEVRSSNYIFKDYNFGASNGVSNSNNYSLMQAAGEGAVGKVESPNYKLGEGLAFTAGANVPQAPTLTNPDNYYNKLSLLINTGGNPSDTVYAIAVSPDGFTDVTRYIQLDHTLGASPVWQTVSAWGAGGFTIIGLEPGITYSAKVSAIQGEFTQSPYGPAASAATANPTLSFSFSPNSVDIGQLTPSTVVTAATAVTVSVDTNSTGGGTVYIYDSNGGLKSPAMNYTISAVSADLGVVAEGYGIRGTSVSQTAGGPMEILTPYNGAGTNVGTVSQTNQPLFDTNGSPVTAGQGVFEIKAKASAVTREGTDYADTITLIATAVF